ncbi:superoxide dismutase, Fe-Mn family [Sporothrix schenckii 1099-18]|uniref:Manganese/iron superoxide dismutase C-terminal domain-containing protein n=2 Tax=Sporothrix schenckii TaxID=29908 RepID=U7PKY3_SPOS1|nr:superoxide dismutase, Fe-Mn family [Sporothrix schenckii 1099-18]ERS95576.1 hypothetical protein HMPREF1624_08092 [Sporothrix schenckii ATCC 58251]KJR86582.1 superoxide dismutase, Fe-Mn family [Sporothrix schenckii 1099-18]
MFRPRLRAPAALGGNITISSSSGASMLARRPAQSALAPIAQARRSIHHLPVSRHDARVGVPNLLSAEGFDLAWTQHMTLMLNRLNQLAAGTTYEDRELKSIIIRTAGNQSSAAIFNYASMAHNTDFFFKHIIPASASPAEAAAAREIPATLRLAIEDNFGSVETLRREFLAIAQGMFGPGFIWLVKANGLNQMGRGGDSLRLLNTYHAGSPYPGAHYRRQMTDMNTVGAEVAENEDDPAENWLKRQAVAADPSLWKQPDRRPPGGVEAIPLLCVSTWEHVWLRDYGLGADGYGGKAAFVEAWWNAIDWEAVASLANLNRPKLKT